MTSFRAEAFGMWSILLFVIKAHKFFNLPSKDKLSLYCDNKALVNMIKHLMDQQRPQFPNDTLKPDWDIINEIVLLLKATPQKVSWIRGHQDNDKDLEEIPLPAQLNCEADELASEVHDIEFDWNVKNPKPPNNSVQIHLGKKTITSHLKHTLRQTIKQKPLLDYIAKKAKWHPTTTDLVDWESHKRAIGLSQLPSKFITKFIHQILPTGIVVHRYKPYYNSGCPSCNEQNEDQFHVLTCQATDRVTWIGNLKKEIIKFCTTTNTSEEIQLLLINGISDHLQDCELEYPEQYPQSMQTLIEEHHLIGWDQLLMGRMSKLWLQLHQHQLQQRKIQLTNFNSGLHWTSSLINIFWTQVHKVWTARNKARHGKDLAEQLQKRHKQYVDEIACYYNYKVTNQLLLSPDMEDMFYSSLQKHLHFESSLHQMETWLSTYRDIIEASRVAKNDYQVTKPTTASPSILVAQETATRTHLKNDTIQFEVCTSQKLSSHTQHPSTISLSTLSTSSCSISTLNNQLVTLRAVPKKKEDKICPTDGLVKK